MIFQGVLLESDYHPPQGYRRPRLWDEALRQWQPSRGDLTHQAPQPAQAHQPEAALERMDEWNQRQHGGSGLVQRVRASQIDAAAAESATLVFLRQHVAAGASPMCGNSICQDRRFLARHMPELEKFFHYRNLDVSTLKELARRWLPAVADGLNKIQPGQPVRVATAAGRPAGAAP